MAYKMAYEVVVCKKQNGPCNEKTTRFLDFNFKSDHFFTSFRDLCCPPPHLPTSFTACAIHCHATHFVLCESPLERLLRSPLRDIVVGKIRGEWKKIQGGRKKYFSNVLRSLAKLLRSLEKLCVLLQNFCVLSQRYLRSLAKLKKKKIFTRESKSFARERKYLCERTQKFCERTQSFSRERKSFARERKTFEKYFFLTPWIFSTHSDFFPPQCPLKGSVDSQPYHVK